MKRNYNIQVRYPEPCPACACGCRLTWAFRPDSFCTEGRWQCNACGSTRYGLPHPEVRKVYDPQAMREEEEREKKVKEGEKRAEEREKERAREWRNERRRERRAEKKEAEVERKRNEEADKEYYTQKSIAENSKTSSGPEDCSACGSDDSVYLGGYCFNCGAYRPSTKKGEPGGNRDAYDYMQMTYGTRLNNTKWMENG